MSDQNTTNVAMLIQAIQTDDIDTIREHLVADPALLCAILPKALEKQVGPDTVTVLAQCYGTLTVKEQQEVDREMRYHINLAISTAKRISKAAEAYPQSWADTFRGARVHAVRLTLETVEAALANDISDKLIDDKTITLLSQHAGVSIIQIAAVYGYRQTLAYLLTTPAYAKWSSAEIYELFKRTYEKHPEIARDIYLHEMVGASSPHHESILPALIERLPMAMILGSEYIQQEFNRIFALPEEEVVAFVDKQGDSVLHWAVRSGDVALVQLVCTQYNKLINQVSPEQGAPLHVAIDMHALAISRMLAYDFHASLFVLNAHWLTPLACAKYNVDTLSTAAAPTDPLDAVAHEQRFHDAKAILHAVCQLPLIREDAATSIVSAATLMQLAYRGKRMTQGELQSIKTHKSGVALASAAVDMYMEFTSHIVEISNNVLMQHRSKTPQAMTSKAIGELVQGVCHGAWKLPSLDLAMNLFVLLPLLPQTKVNLFLSHMENRIGQELNLRTDKLDFNFYMGFLKEVILLLKTQALYLGYVEENNPSYRSLNFLKKQATDKQLPYASIQAIRAEDKDFIGETHAFAKLALHDAEQWMVAQLQSRHAAYIEQYVAEQQQVQRDAVAQYFAPVATEDSALVAESAVSHSDLSSGLGATSVTPPASPPLGNTWCTIHTTSRSSGPLPSASGPYPYAAKS